MRTCVRWRVRSSLCAYVRTYVLKCVCAFVYACVRNSDRTCVRASVSVLACVQACMSPSACARMCVC